MQDIWLYCHIWDKQPYKWCYWATILPSAQHPGAGISFLFSEEEEEREREPHGPFCLFTSRMGMGATRCACPLQEAGLAKLSLQETQRLGLVQRMAELPSIRLLLDICAPHQPDRPTSTQLDLSKKKTNLFIYLNPHVSLSMWVDSPL